MASSQTAPVVLIVVIIHDSSRLRQGEKAMVLGLILQPFLLLKAWVDAPVV